MPYMRINTSIFCHIQLDSELNGRFGVQGNTFSNTFGYLEQYFKQCNVLPENLKKLSQVMVDLVKREEAILALNHSQQPITTFVEPAAREIIALREGGDYLLPGGWAGKPSGHAMIYQFQKEADGALLFSIYNSGAGLNKHEKYSSSKTERFFPVKIYKIPASSASEHDLRVLLHQLVLPQVSSQPERKQEVFDENKLYRAIEEALPFLDAMPIHAADRVVEHASTAGQLSGTCAQRSIHQMLKINFDNLPAYQRFILDFKVYALKDFVATHPAPRSPQIAVLINDAIKNNLKIAQEPGVFNDLDEQNQLVCELIDVQQMVLMPEAIKNPLAEVKPVERHYIYNLGNEGAFMFQESVKEQRITRKKIDAPVAIKSQRLLQTMAAVIEHCNGMKQEDPLGVLEQVEQTILQLPLPEQAIQHGCEVELQTYYDDLPFYRELTQAADFDTMAAYIEALQQYYSQASNALYGDNQLPHAFIVQCSLLALHDYVDVQQAKRGFKPSFHNAINAVLGDFLTGFQSCPYLATNHPDLDRRWVHLTRLYQNRQENGRRTLSTIFAIYHNETYYRAYYNALLDGYPTLKMELANYYTRTYEQDKSTLHELLRLEQYTELYYLFTQMDETWQLKASSPLNFNKFDALLRQIKRQVELEQFFIRCFNPLIQDPYQIGSILDIVVQKLSDGKEKLKHVSPHSSSRLEFAKFTTTKKSNATCIAQQKYNLGKSKALDALLEDYPSGEIYQLSNNITNEKHQRPKKPANELQLAPNGDKNDRVINKDDFYTRQLFHLRASPANQINFTLDYFSVSLDKLADVNTQRYIEANIFEPGLLCKALDNDATLLTRFDDFIRKALRHFIDHEGKNSQESLFFIRLNVILNRYVARYQHAQSEARLKSSQEQLSTWIAEPGDLAIRASLHVYRFLTNVALYELNASLKDKRIFEEACASYFYLKVHTNPQRKEDTASHAEVQRAERLFKRWLQHTPSATITPLIKPVLESLGLAIRDYVLKGTYPLFTLTNRINTMTYTVNVESGRVFKDNNAYSVIPLELQLHPLIRALGLQDEVFCFVSAENTRVEFVTADMHVQMKKDFGSVWSAQKEWTLDGKIAWYQLKNLEQVHIESMWSVRNELPKVLTDGSMASWISCDIRGHSFVARNQQPIYRETFSKNFEQLDEQGCGTEYYIAPNVLAEQDDLTRFEGLGFFTINLKQKEKRKSFGVVSYETQKKGTVDFIRYGLSLEVSEQGIKLPGTNYRLQPLSSSVFGPDIAALHFKDGDYQQCLVAVQSFYTDPKSSNAAGNYFQLKHDTSNFIPQMQLKNARKKQGLTEDNQAPWYYENSAKTITYKLVNGTPKPETAADAFYLCYLYLAQDEVEKAWTVLDDLNQRLSCDGGLDELTYLAWITQGLPVILDDKENKNETDAIRNTPRYVACQLKALACYIDYLAQGKGPVIPGDNACDLTRANGCYESLHLNTVKKFYNELSGTLYELYSRLQQGARHLDEQYNLSFAARKSLLAYYSAHTHSNAQGALGYEQRRLNLETLFTEYRHLRAMQVSAPHACLPVFVERLNAIDTHLKTQLPVMKQSTVLECVAIDLSLPEEIHLNTSLLLHEALMQFLDWESEVFNTRAAGTEVEAMQVLCSGITQDAFIKHFPRYLHVACDGANNSKEVLRKFCVKCLTGHRHTPLDKQNTNTAYLVNLLYRVVSNPGCLKKMSRKRYLSNLSELTSTVRNFSVPEIKVYQARDVFDEVLATSLDIWQNLEQETRVEAPMSAPMFKQDASRSMTGLIQTLCSKNNKFNHACERYRMQESQYQTALHAITESLQGTPMAVDLERSEQQVGKLKYASVQEQRSIAEDMFATHEQRHVVYEEVARLDSTLQPQLEKTWTDALSLAHAPNTLMLERRFRAELAASLRHKPTKKELLTLYLRADYTAYIERTGLSRENCEKLHTLLHQCVALGVEAQHARRLFNALKDAGEKPTDKPTPASLHHVANVLMSENTAHAERDPSIMLFQHEENILLRPRQVDALSKLLSRPKPHQFNETIEKIIMGGGKSKVILPLLAAKKASGLNLVVVEVPRALLATNYVDLNNTSQRLFGQKAYRFEFDRDSDCSPERLEAIYQQFMDIMTHQGYLVTTGESMQSLELKYLELLLSRPDQKEEEIVWKQQIEWASKITQLIKQRGDVVIDEVHQGLLLKKKLNYTLGEPEPVHKDAIRYSIALYQFWGVLVEERGIENPWAQSSVSGKHLINALLTHTRSPLKKYIKQLRTQYGPACMDELNDYLNNGPGAEACFEKLRVATPALRNAFAFYKEQLSLLPQTLGRHHKEHYGPSQEASKSAMKRVLAIPYSANNKPSERSRFGNPLETINYTMQSMLLDGLNKEMLVEVLKAWQAEARHELQKHHTKYATIEETPTAEGVARLLEGTDLTLQTINLRNDVQVNQVFEHTRHNKALLFKILEEYVLKQLTVEPSILHSDAYNHVDMYRSRQGLSGTPWNYSTYHQNLQYNHNTSLGTDGYIQTILKTKKTSIHGLEFTSCRAFLPQLYTQLKLKQNVRAIIDIGATFVGLSNAEVASELGAYVSTYTPLVRYVLYFNDDDVLCALDVKKPNQPIVLGSSDPIEIEHKLNGCKPENRLTYYDQAHTIGVDISQSTLSNAVVLVDEKTHLQSFLQGCMRMRGLENQQTVEIIVPKALAGKSLEALLEHMLNSQRNQLQDDGFISALAKMDNIVRHDLIGRLASVDDIDTKIVWAKAFERYFIETKSQDLFEQYGAVSSMIDTQRLLVQRLSYLIQDWKRCLVSIKHVGTEDEARQLQQAMQGVIHGSLPYCKPKSMSRAKQSIQNLEVEVQQEQEMLQEEEKLEEAECFNPDFEAVPHVPWSKQGFNMFLKGMSFTMSELNQVCGSIQKDKLAFSPQLFVSNNYRNVYLQQKQMMGFYLKPVHAILFTMTGNFITGSKLYAYVLTNQEAEEFHALLKDRSNADVWLSTMQDTCLAGHRSKGMIARPEYQILMEQIRFFNGDCNTFLEQITPFVWLNKNTKSKLTYFEKHILPYREATSSEFSRLQSALSNKEQGFKYIKAHAFEDLSDVDWAEEFPDAMSSDLTAFEALATACDDANKSYLDKSGTLDSLLSRHMLPPAAVTFLKEHLALLNDFSNTVKKIEASSPSKLSINILDSKQTSSLQNVLGINIDSLIKQHQCNAKQHDKVNWQLLTLDLLMSLIQSPMVKDTTKLLRLLEKNPLLEGVVIKKPVSSLHLVLALFNSPHVGITAQHFERIQTYAQTSETRMAQFKHRHIKVGNVDHVMKNFDGDIKQALDMIVHNNSLKSETKVGILGRMITAYGSSDVLHLAKKYLPEASLALLIENSLADAHVSSVLIGLIQKTNQAFCALMLTQIISGEHDVRAEVYHAVLSAYPALSKADIDHVMTRLIRVLTTSKFDGLLVVDEAVLTRILNNKDITDGTLQVVLKHFDLSKELLIQVIQQAKTQKTLLGVVQHKNTTEDLFEFVLNQLKTYRGASVVGEVLALMLQANKKIVDNPVFFDVAKHAASHQDVFEALIKVSEKKVFKFDDMYMILDQYRKQKKAQDILKNMPKTTVNYQDEGLQALHVTIDKLRMRAYELMFKAMNATKAKRDEYKPIGKAAFELHNKLNHLTQRYALDEEASKAYFADEVINLVTEYKPLLQEDPGLKEILLEMINVVLKFFSDLIQKINPNFKMGFFESRTTNVVVMEDIEDKAKSLRGG